MASLSKIYLFNDHIIKKKNLKSYIFMTFIYVLYFLKSFFSSWYSSTYLFLFTINLDNANSVFRSLVWIPIFQFNLNSK